MTKLNARQKQVLKGVVEEYVKHSEPVGSARVAEMLPFSVSSATIRGDMAELTDSGYLVQPHTSAGRIPTEAGFKEYIETMMKEHKELSLRQQEVLSAHFKRLKNLQERFKEAARMLSELSGSVGLLMDDANQVYMSGLSKLPQLPEFRDEEFGADFMEMLENPAESFRSIMKQTTGQPQVVLGKASMVVTKFGPGGRQVISVIGPMRMHYGKTLPAVEYIAKLLNNK
ncbi:MAG: hypothetical protein VE98_C0001G0040 [candidate division Kazan bacterium GW2011_GWA1_50_15]|uniref:Transcriptional regulator of heat shock protein n=2 Tax=Bacteria division Kazan-3B-28 TaxID=1798534 RepID=A0A0G1ZGF5_UNCK3|nr:MAG: hypothetical protein VE98_C0001G0040 [candidate division Kazan bacterium GW2011_GWA1_50_15]KKW25677.1 MAG: Transcriptional regulator of heat shock protein [candidate division Kazan bacterium GW2011_GWC1_52_13]KKW26982.1 MAG: Transcriptional regulator of heat shock protein [candidate division Kazan bacterium GW2011_GWB1_52_7]HAV66030.1 hypothetical protein [Patescibacteria group bacterium]